MAANPILDLVNYPGNHWKSAIVGCFRLHWWPLCEPPTWWLENKTSYVVDSSRAFQGTPATGVDGILKAFERTTAFMNDLGMGTAARGESSLVEVVLWDSRFPLPTGWSLQVMRNDQLSDPVCFCSLDKDVPVLILLPTYSEVHPMTSESGWLKSSTVHECFHALLVRWLGRDVMIDKYFRNSAWTKFEEMCAVSLETKLMHGENAWLEYGRAWRSSLALSYCGHQELVPGRQNDSILCMRVNREDYAHFAFLSFIDDVVWPERQRGQHWLPTVWSKAAMVHTGTTPWGILNGCLESDGGLSEVFLRYVREAVFPETSDSIPAQLRLAFGPPAAAEIIRRGEDKLFIIGPLAAQVLSCRLTEGSKSGGVLRITALHGGFHCHIESQKIAGPSGAPQRLICDRKPAAKNKAIWELPLPNKKAEGAEYAIIVCQPDYNGDMLAITAEWM